MSDDIVFLVLRTFASVFPAMEIWDTQEGDLVLLGGLKPWESSPARFQLVFQRSQPEKDLAEVLINSPTILWARQVASQLTAAAIPGDGPIQTDEFPVLEYTAPEAFFIGRSADKLYFFDERTVQFPLVSREKISALRALPDQALLDSFLKHGASPDMMLYLRSITARATGSAPAIDPMFNMIFRSPDSYPNEPRISNASPEYVECIKAEAAMLRDDANWKQHAGRIEQVLTKLLATRNDTPKDFSPAAFAAVIARFAIGHRDYQASLEALRFGFSFSTSNEQLLFLSRILDKILPPDALKQIREHDKASTTPK